MVLITEIYIIMADRIRPLIIIIADNFKNRWQVMMLQVRYYHDEELMMHTSDKTFQFLAFSYFYKEPKKFEEESYIFLTMNEV